MEVSGEIRHYLESARSWLRAAERSSDIPEPAAFLSLHSLELAVKAALLAETGEEYKTHNIGGEFGKFFREEAGKDRCGELNKKLMRYDPVRYPETDVEEKEAEEILEFAEEFVNEVVPEILERRNV
ncbi:MAG: HEPN domain-containing protein [Candidatus Nanohaloarchaea archaeon]|nr:HEPN domain-containing protein [Candidatus Nanohaloarchaea archaeon]